MVKVNLLVTEEIDLKYLSLLPAKKFKIVTFPEITNKELINLSDNFDALLIKSSRIIDKNFIDKCGFKLIATCSRGTDHIDTGYAKKKGITVLFSSGANCISTAEHTLALIIEIYKNIKYSDNLIRNGNFSDLNFERRELYEKKIGIIGIGKVGSYVAKLAGAFGMKIYANDIDMEVRKKNNRLNFRSLNFILKNSDIITIHIPLNKNNYKFFSREKLNLLNGNSILINTSRGQVIDEKHLIKMLKNKGIKYAGLDVYWNEPDINKNFLGINNVILTNHIAGKTVESKSKMVKDIISRIKNYYLKI